MPSLKDQQAQSTNLEQKLWLTADKLRNNMDAAEYKHIVLGLIFLKYISDAFNELHNKLTSEISNHHMNRYYSYDFDKNNDMNINNNVVNNFIGDIKKNQIKNKIKMIDDDINFYITDSQKAKNNPDIIQNNIQCMNNLRLDKKKLEMELSNIT